MKKLSLDETWVQCLKMWKWVVGNTITEPKDVYRLKAQWLQENEHGKIRADCFFCEYKGGLRDGGCKSHCPAAMVDKSFSCDNDDYNYIDKPKEFYEKILALNKERNKMDIKEAYKVMQEASGIEVGDTVRILRANVYNELGSNAIAHSKEEYESHGWQGQVQNIRSGAVVIRSDDNKVNWVMPFFVLEIVEKAKKEEMVDVDGTMVSLATIKAGLRKLGEQLF